MTLHAVKYVQPMSWGETKPQLIQCDDGQLYVVKFMSNPIDVKVLVNELVCTSIGKMMGLPIIKGTVIHFTHDFIQSSQVLQQLGVQAGPHFGSLYLKNANIATIDTLLKCSNLPQIGNMIVFDHWIHEHDRRKHNANVIIDESDKQTQFYMIDHGDAFDGPCWSIEKLRRDQSHPNALWGTFYQQLVPFIDHPEDPFREGLERIESISQANIKQSIDSVPDEWQVSKDERKALFTFLMNRRAQLRPMLKQLKPHFPRWNQSR